MNRKFLLLKAVKNINKMKIDEQIINNNEQIIDNDRIINNNEMKIDEQIISNEQMIDNDKIINNNEMMIDELLNLREESNLLFDDLHNIIINNDDDKLKEFIKNNTEYVIKNDVLELLSFLVPDDNNTLNILNNFYSLVKEKMEIILILKKWKDVYDNEEFWDMTLPNQITFLHTLRLRFLSIYDCSQGGNVYHLKLMMIFKSNRYHYRQIMDDVEDRLRRSLELIGKPIFKYLDIKLITLKELYSFTHKEIIDYFNLIFNNVKKLLDDVIILFEGFNHNCNTLDKLLCD